MKSPASSVNRRPVGDYRNLQHTASPSSTARSPPTSQIEATPGGLFVPKPAGSVTATVVTMPELWDRRQPRPPSAVPAPGVFGLRVESGGLGASTITRLKVTAGGPTREYRNMAAEPEPGRILTESTPAPARSPRSRSPHAAPRVSYGSPLPGIVPTRSAGLFERMFAPRGTAAIYADELKRLHTYPREHRSA
jgi:hypothetical protein